jgi:hypothetical protein
VWEILGARDETFAGFAQVIFGIIKRELANRGLRDAS